MKRQCEMSRSFRASLKYKSSISILASERCQDRLEPQVREFYLNFLRSMARAALHLLSHFCCFWICRAGVLPNLGDPCHAIKVIVGLRAIISFFNWKGQEGGGQEYLVVLVSEQQQGPAALESNPGGATMPLLCQSPTQGWSFNSQWRRRRWLLPASVCNIHAIVCILIKLLDHHDHHQHQHHHCYDALACTM